MRWYVGDCGRRLLVVTTAGLALGGQSCYGLLHVAVVVDFVVFNLHIFAKLQAGHAVSSVALVAGVVLALDDRIL